MEGARPANPADLDVIVGLADAAVAELGVLRGGSVWERSEARPAPRRGGLEAALAAEDGFLVVGTIDDAVVGYGVVALRELHDGALLGSVSDIYVEPEARGVGVGEAMMDALVLWCREQGCVGVDSLALPGDRATKNFFETHGLVARAILVHRSL